VAVTNEREFRAWLEKQPQEVCVAMAFRAAIRVLPIATRLEAFEVAERLTLFNCRSIVTSGVVAVGPTPDLQNASYAVNYAAKAAEFAASTAGSYAIFAATRAAAAAADAAAAATSNAAATAAAEAAIAAATAASAAANASVTATDTVRAAPTAYLDTTLLLDKMMAETITLPSDYEATIGPVRDAADNALTLGKSQDSPWSFWARWYAAAMAGDPLPWDLQEQIALIPNEVWETGPEAVAEEIARIEAEFKLRASIADIEADQAHSVDNRLGIGGNNPPVEIDDPETGEQVVVIWESIAGLNEEVNAEQPDAKRVADLIDRLTAALRIVLAWCGRKADLAVDTAIKWSIPAVGGYFFLNPAKVEAVLEAAKAWLLLLAP
jgi:hypothetical protein